MIIKEKTATEIINLPEVFPINKKIGVFFYFTCNIVTCNIWYTKFLYITTFYVDFNNLKASLIYIAWWYGIDTSYIISSSVYADQPVYLVFISYG